MCIQSLRAFHQAVAMVDAELFESCVGGVAVAMTVASIFHFEFWFLWGVVLGAFLGAIFAIQLNGNLLKNIIGTFILLVAIQISFNLNLSVRKNNVSREPYIIGTGIGFLSSILGIGGGIFSVPYFKYLGLNMTSSVGTSAACGIPIAFFGALVYFILGASNDNLPSLTFGYIYLPALFGITITSIFSAKFGADIAHYVSEITLKKLMVSLMLLISIYMFVI